MKWLYLVPVFWFCSFLLPAQEFKSANISSNAENYQQGPALNIYDSLYQLSIPELVLPENLKAFALPAKVDNSKLPYLRPVFTQVGASCGQSSAIGYNFTYEMDNARGVSADTSVNQYPTHFTYNFENGGYEYYGVSYFHSFEILRRCGCMNCNDYGGFTDNGGRWITGYDLYYNGMHNRIEDVYTIKTNTSKGILALKNWIYNHMGESSDGGVASFYCGGREIKTLPSGTPEQGKFIATFFHSPATHAMTIVGYNDSICYDYNNDGLYTNDVDLNNDGIIDVRDWEIGGFKYVNSYGLQDLDSGFCYMMYRTLAESYSTGGIWNNAVHVIKVKPDYTPLLTMRIRLNHSKRSALRVQAGVSADANAGFPDYLMEFPIFNFQGGNFPMQGPGGQDSLYTIEFGLDITPLLSYIPNGKPSSFFLSVEENDPYAQEAGSIEYLAVIDYSNPAPLTTVCQSAPIELVNNAITYAKVTAVTNINKVKIDNPAISPFTEAQPVSIQLNATGGQPPYTWSLNYNYTRLTANKPYDTFGGTKISQLTAADSIVPVSLGFDFTFYGKLYDTVYVNLQNGILQFTKDLIPWPYNEETDLLLKSFRVIAPLANICFDSKLYDEGVWYESLPGSIKFRWMLRKKIGDVYYPYEFQARLFEDGHITFSYSYITVNTPDAFFAGISEGDKQNFKLSGYYNEYDANRFNQVEFVPHTYPNDLKISQTGLLECIPGSAEQIYGIDCKATDYRNVSDTKTIHLSSGIISTLQIHAGNDSIIGNGEVVIADLILTNITGNNFPDITSLLSIGNEFITCTDTLENINSLPANSTLIVPDAFRFSVSTEAPDGQIFQMNIDVSSNLQSWKNRLPAQINAPLLKSIELSSTKPGKEILQPGETGTLRYTFSNIGHSPAQDVDASVMLTHPSVKLLSSATQSMGTVLPGQQPAFDFEVKIADTVQLGSRIPVAISLSIGNKHYLTDTLYFRTGKRPVLVIDLDKKHESAPVIYQQIIDLGYISEYSSVINPDIAESQSIFMCLGKYSDRYILSYSEARVLYDYLEKGGNLYLESYNFWRDDPKTILHSLFNIETKNKFHKYDTLIGSSGLFTENMQFLYMSLSPVSMYYLLPVGSATSIFNDDGFFSHIANDAGNYKTIGCLFEFAALQGINDSSTQPILMQKYLDFFEIRRNTIGIDESHTYMEAGTITVYPNPAKEYVLLRFTLNEKHAEMISIMDINGTEIARLTDKPGIINESHVVEWNLRSKTGVRVPPGLYFCRIISGKEVKLGKIMVK